MYSTSTTEYEPIPVFRKLELRKHGPVYKFFNNALKNPYVLIAPAVIIALGTTIFAIGYCIYMSFIKWDMISGTREFVGFDNYKFIFRQSKLFRRTCRHSCCQCQWRNRAIQLLVEQRNAQLKHK